MRTAVSKLRIRSDRSHLSEVLSSGKGSFLTSKRLRQLITGSLMLLLLSSCGGGDIDGNSSEVRAERVLELFAGDAGGSSGSTDGPVATARFLYPNGVAIDSVGNIYVADYGNHTIRKITPEGTVTTLAGTAGVQGHADGTGSQASFNFPKRVTADSTGNIYVADVGNYTIRKITPDGVVTTFAGTSGVQGHTDGTGSAASFSSPVSAAVDSVGNLYVADAGSHVIRKITSAGVVTTLGTAGVVGHDDGVGAAARFFFPSGVATDGADNVYVADAGNNIIRKISPTGMVTTLAGTVGVGGQVDGIGAEARFASPTGLAIDSAGNVYVVDETGPTIRKITPDGVVTTLAGTAGVQGHADGSGAQASFTLPEGVAIDSTGNLYVADSANNTIRKITPTGIVTTLTGTAPSAGHADGVRAAASFDSPFGVATDSSGTVYVADTYNHTIRKITLDGMVTTLAGSAGNSGYADGTGTAARFAFPRAVATDGKGNIYVADGNDIIRKITPAGMVSTLAGTAGVVGNADGTGAQASFHDLSGIATDGAGNVYVADGVNETIRKITPGGLVTTLAGMTGVSGHADGIGATASFNGPSGIATDSAGNIYVADTGNNIIRKITPAGAVTTLAGTAGVQGHTDGVGSQASFKLPSSVVTDSAGNIYVSDSGNYTIRMITPAGAVTTLVGKAGVAGFTPGALPGGLPAPFGIAIGNTPFGSTLYITTVNAVLQVRDVPVVTIPDCRKGPC